MKTCNTPENNPWYGVMDGDTTILLKPSFIITSLCCFGVPAGTGHQQKKSDLAMPGVLPAMFPAFAFSGAYIL